MKKLLVGGLFRACEILSAGRCTHPPPAPGRILVLTAWTPDIADIGRLSSPNKQAYARRHGYAFREHTHGFDPARPPAWSKLLFIATALREFDTVFWTDADALVMDSGIRLEPFLQPGIDVLLTETAVPHRHVNTGHMIFRSTPFSRLFLVMAWRLTGFLDKSDWEQGAVNHLVRNFRLRRLAVVPNRRFNAFAGVEGDPDPYAPGDFIVHFPGLKDKLTPMRHHAGLAP